MGEDIIPGNVHFDYIHNDVEVVISFPDNGTQFSSTAMEAFRNFLR